MEAFHRASDGSLEAVIEPGEVVVLSRLTGQVAQLLGHRGRPGSDRGDGDDGGLDDGHDVTPPEAAERPGDPDAVLMALEWEPSDPVPPRDPALARLLPAASHDDEELAAELRRLTEQSIRDHKIARLLLVRRCLRRDGIARVAASDVDAWLGALTDIRLVLAARLGVETDEDADRVYQRVHASATDSTGAPAEDLVLAGVYTALTWWQESLLDAWSRLS